MAETKQCQNCKNICPSTAKFCTKRACKNPFDVTAKKKCPSCSTDNDAVNECCENCAVDFVVYSIELRRGRGCCQDEDETQVQEQERSRSRSRSRSRERTKKRFTTGTGKDKTMKCFLCKTESSAGKSKMCQCCTTKQSEATPANGCIACENTKAKAHKLSKLCYNCYNDYASWGDVEENYQ